MSNTVTKKDQQPLPTSVYNINDAITTQYDQRLQMLMSKQPNLTEPFPFENLAAEVLKAKSPLLYGSSIELKRQEIRKYFHDTFTTFEKLHEVLLNDDIFFYQPERLRHPLVFYFGHTAVFFLNKLNIAGVIKHRIDPSIESMCAIGVDEMSWDDLNPSHYNWPTINRLREYRKQVRALVDDLILNLPLTLPINWESPLWIILMGIEHERIHLETSSVLFRQLPPHCVKQTDLLKLFPYLSTPVEHSEANLSAVQKANQQLIQNNNHIINHVNITTEVTHILPETPLLDDINNVYNKADGGYITYSEDLRKIANRSEPGHLQLNLSQIAQFYSFLNFILNGGYYNQSYWSDEGWKFAQYKTGTLKQAWPHFWQPVAVELQGITYPAPTPAILEAASAEKAKQAQIKQAEVQKKADLDEQFKAAAIEESKCDEEGPTDISTPSQSQRSITPSSPSSDDDSSIVMSDTDEGVVINKKFNSTMRVHPLPYPSKLTITDYKYRWLSGLTEMPWDWPVDLNNLESQAYARFVQAQLYGEESLQPTTPTTPTDVTINDSKDSTLPQQAVCRLPTEFEYRSLQYHILSTYGQLSQNEPVEMDTTKPFQLNKYDFALSDLTNTASEQNLSLLHASSSPVDYYQYHNSGFYDVVGNVWQHCCSVIYPLRDFQVHSAYDDFTVPTFDNMHGLIVGGSWIATGNEACFNARYAFRRHFYQHAGARIGFFTSKPNTGEELQSIEQDTTIANRLHADFYDLLTNADLVKCETPNNKQLLTSRDVNAKLTAQLVSDTITKLNQKNQTQDSASSIFGPATTTFTPKEIMVLGCRGGRLPLELAALYPEAKLQGIDVTTRLLGAGLRMMNGAKISYLLKTSYQQTNYVCVREEALDKHFIQRGFTNPQEQLYNRIELMQTDICNLPEDKVPLHSYNLVIIDCLDTAYNPKLLLQNIHRHLKTAKPCSSQTSIVALNIYHQWEQETQDNCDGIWGYRDETNGEFVDVERGIANIVPNNWNLVHRADFNQRIRRINERIYSLYDMTTYFYAVTPLPKQ